jgi:hypothetical protein
VRGSSSDIGYPACAPLPRLTSRCHQSPSVGDWLRQIVLDVGLSGMEGLLAANHEGPWLASSRKMAWK